MGIQPMGSQPPGGIPQGGGKTPQQVLQELEKLLGEIERFYDQQPPPSMEQVANFLKQHLNEMGQLRADAASLPQSGQTGVISNLIDMAVGNLRRVALDHGNPVNVEEAIALLKDAKFELSQLGTP